MGLLFIDGFDSYTTEAEMDTKWNVGSNITTFLSTGGRFGGGSSQLDVSTNELFWYSIPSTTTAVLGGAFFADTVIQGPASGNYLLGMTEAGVAEHITVGNLYGYLVVRLGGGLGTELGRTATAVLESEMWHYIEMKVLISGTATGTVEVHLDGVQVINLSGIVTSNSVTNVVNNMVFRAVSTSSVQDIKWDDCYVSDGTALLGDCRVDQIMPDGDGTYTEFGTTIPSSPTTHWDKVEEVPPDTNTSYNEATATNQRDTFTMSNLPATTSQTIHGLQQNVYGVYITGATNMRHKLRISGVDHDGSSIALGSGWGYETEMWVVDPQTTVAWTESGVNGIESGYEEL